MLKHSNFHTGDSFDRRRRNEGQTAKMNHVVGNPLNVRIGDETRAATVQRRTSFVVWDCKHDTTATMSAAHPYKLTAIKNTNADAAEII